MFNLIMLFIAISGTISWLIIGVFQFDVIAGIFGSQSMFLSRFIYTIWGLAGIYILLLSGIKKGQLNLISKKGDKKKIKDSDSKNK